jgi:hypothetical protein
MKKLLLTLIFSVLIPAAAQAESKMPLTNDDLLKVAVLLETGEIKITELGWQVGWRSTDEGKNISMKVTNPQPAVANIDMGAAGSLVFRALQVPGYPPGVVLFRLGSKDNVLYRGAIKLGRRAGNGAPELEIRRKDHLGFSIDTHILTPMHGEGLLTRDAKPVGYEYRQLREEIGPGRMPITVLKGYGEFKFLGGSNRTLGWQLERFDDALDRFEETVMFPEIADGEITMKVTTTQFKTPNQQPFYCVPYLQKLTPQ